MKVVFLFPSRKGTFPILRMHDTLHARILRVFPHPWPSLCRFSKRWYIVVLYTTTEETPERSLKNCCILCAGEKRLHSAAACIGVVPVRTKLSWAGGMRLSIQKKIDIHQDGKKLRFYDTIGDGSFGGWGGTEDAPSNVTELGKQKLPCRSNSWSPAHCWNREFEAPAPNVASYGKTGSVHEHHRSYPYALGLSRRSNT